MIMWKEICNMTTVAFMNDWTKLDSQMVRETSTFSISLLWMRSIPESHDCLNAAHEGSPQEGVPQSMVISSHVQAPLHIFSYGNIRKQYFTKECFHPLCQFFF